MWLRSPAPEDTGVQFLRPEGLTVTLYVREALGISPAPFGPASLPMDREVPAALGGGDQQRLDEQWAQWWSAVLQRTVAAHGRAPVDYYSPLLEKGALLHAAEPLLPVAHRWFIENRRPWDGIRSPEFRPGVVERVATETLGRRRRRGHGKLLFLLLPLAGQRGYRLSGSAWIVTESLVADLPAFEAWLRAELRSGS